MKTLLLLGVLLTSTFSFSQLSNGMIGYFPFDGSPNDISSSMITGTNVGCGYGQDRNGVAGEALTLTGSSYVSTPNGSPLKCALPVSISAWIKLDSMGLVNLIFTTDNVFENYYGYWMGVNSSGNPNISFGAGLGGANSSNRRSYRSDAVLNIGQWYHVVGIIRAAADMDIYVDCNQTTGTYTGTGSTSIAYSTSESRFGSHIGNNAAPSGLWTKGSFDEMAIWNRALNPSEITYLCNSQNSLTIQELIEMESKKELVKVVDFLGRETTPTMNTPLIYIYSDGTTERKMVIEK